MNKYIYYIVLYFMINLTHTNVLLNFHLTNQCKQLYSTFHLSPPISSKTCKPNYRLYQTLDCVFQHRLNREFPKHLRIQDAPDNQGDKQLFPSFSSSMNASFVKRGPGTGGDFMCVFLVDKRKDKCLRINFLQCCCANSG